ncbi:MAG: glycosyltransferase family 4 protein [Acidimicrobiales bacterium]
MLTPRRKTTTPNVSLGLDELVKLGDLAASAGIRRVHMLAWRDLADVEAGGSEIHAATVAKLWAEAGLDVTMRTSWAQGAPTEAQRDGYRVVRRAGRYMVFPRSIVSELSGRLGQRDAVVEIWNGVPFFSPVWARGPRIVFLHHHHDKMWPLTLGPKLARVGSTLETRLAPPFYRNTQIVTLSHSSKAELIEHLGFRENQMTVVPPGIDPRFTPGEKSPTPLIVAVGRLMTSKRFDLLISLVERLRNAHPDLELVIVGEGYEQDNLEDLLRNLDAEQWVTLAGSVSDDELVDLYRRAWIVASTSIAEGWGMTLTEAAACATPAVATDIAGHRDSVADQESGLLASSDEQFIKHLSRLLDDDSYRKQLSDGAIQHASRFTWAATARGALEVLVADAHRKGRGPN